VTLTAIGQPRRRAIDRPVDGRIDLEGGVVAGTATLSNNAGGAVVGRGTISSPFANSGGTLRAEGGGAGALGSRRPGRPGAALAEVVAGHPARSHVGIRWPQCRHSFSRRMHPGFGLV